MHYREVILTIYNYLALLRASTFDSHHFHEIAQMAATTFRFREKSQPHTYARELARRLLEPVRPERILDCGALAREWDEQSVRAVLDYLTPEKGRVIVMAKEHDEAVPGGGGLLNRKWEVERLYGTEYKVHRRDNEFIEQVSTIPIS